VDVCVVECALADVAAAVDERPCGARVIALEEATAVILDKGVDAVAVCARGGDTVAAYMMFGFVRSMLMSIAAVLSSRYSTLRQLLPPSVLLKTPRSAFGTEYLPNEATKMMSGLVGWMRIFEMPSVWSKPRCVHVLPASMDL
jgi:hypothetical protein